VGVVGIFDKMSVLFITTLWYACSVYDSDLVSMPVRDLDFVGL